MNLWEGTKVAEELFASDDPAEIDELAAEFRDLMAVYETAEVELRGIVEDPEMVTLLDSSGVAQENLVALASELVTLRHTYLAAVETTDRLLDAFDAEGAELNAVLESLADMNVAEMAAAEDEGDRLEARLASGAAVNAVLGELFERDFPMVHAAMTLQRLVIEMQDTAGEYLDEHDAEGLAGVRSAFDELYAAVSPQLDLLTQFAETDADREALQELRGRFEELRSIALGDDQLFDAHQRAVETEGLLNVTVSELENSADVVAEDLDRVSEAADAVSDAADEEAATSVAQATMFILALLVTAIVAAGGLIFMVIRSVTGPINAMTSAMGRLAGGDLEVEVPASGSRDEIGAMAKAVQVFKDNAVDKVRLEQESKEQERQAEAEKRRAMQELADRFDQQVGGIVAIVSNQATNLQVTSNQLSAAVEETETQSSAASSAAGEASGSVQTMASATEELSSAIANVSNRLSGASSQLQATANGAREAQARMDELQAAIAQIDQVVSSINDVAEQTNLLALNATIEAARAGEAGKGFAVVASEVKGLANSTRQMTESIAKQLGSVKSASEGALTVSLNIVQEVDALNESTAAIAASMEQQSAATSEIGQSAHQAASGTEVVSSSMVAVQEASVNTSRASDDVSQAAQDLGAQAETLQGAVRDFLKDIREAA